MTYWLVRNPKSGNPERDRQFWVEHLAEAGIHQPVCCDFESRQWMDEVAGDDIVMVAGGDGSVNVGASLCLKTGATLAILPSGTANDFARNLELPDTPEALCRLIASGTTQRVDVTDYGEGIFLNVAHIGVGTLPARESRETEKRLLGRFSYAFKLLRRLNAWRGFRAEIRCDKGVVTGRWLSVAVANGAFFGGGSEMPEASVNDGLLDVVAVRPRSLIQLLFAFVTLRLKHQPPRRISTLVHLKGKRCAIRTGTPKTVTADGEVIGKTPLKASCLGTRLSVVGQGVVRTGSRPAA